LVTIQHVHTAIQCRINYTKKHPQKITTKSDLHFKGNKKIHKGTPRPRNWFAVPEPQASSTWELKTKLGKVVVMSLFKEYVMIRTTMPKVVLLIKLTYHQIQSEYAKGH
jgi:hypothetical protein